MKYDTDLDKLPALQGILISYSANITTGDIETARAIYCVANELSELNRKLDTLTKALSTKI